jgi:DNA-binding Lrp family transcriptional regulator
MAIRSYLLIHVHAGAESKAQAALQALDEIVACDQVTGEMDLIAIAEGPDYQHILGPLLTKIRQIEGISHTQTCLVL